MKLKVHASTLILSAFWVASLPVQAAPQSPAPTQPGRPQGSGIPSPAPQAQAGSSTTHRLTAHLKALGVVSCLARAEQIARFLDPGNQATVAVLPLDSPPNQKLILANMGIPNPAGRDSLAVISLAPNQANGCGGAYQLIATEPGSCSASLKARQAEPKGAIELGSKNILIQSLARNALFFGLQAAGNCTIIKQELLP